TVSICPSSVVMDVGQSQLFTSSVYGGTWPYTYQWYLNDTAIPGANSSTWLFTPSSPGSYTVYLNVTDAVAITAKSNVVPVTVNVLPSVSVTPTSVAMDIYQSKTFNATAVGGTSPYWYEWYLNGILVQNGTSDSWTYTPTTVGSYTLYVNLTDSVGGTAQSNLVGVTVNPELSVSISPTSVVMDISQSVTFISTVSGGTLPYTYNWYLNGTQVASTPNWTFTPPSPGFYNLFLNVTDMGDPTVKSNVVNITVNSDPSISISPTSVTLDVEQSQLFTSTVSGGTPPYSYQWYENDTAIGGATSSSLLFTPVLPGVYLLHLNVTDDAGVTVKSNVAVAT
ncbi:PKD domain-containing protein, partial [Candidatus Bathyarchaeota archaeon]|nr:PKD domain-containing protein [Candidatus Bathyarchaeota archaeon]NIV68346.1 PKD domain-containing protein [Candidatus Bathyarchaeota archaeon]